MGNPAKDGSELDRVSKLRSSLAEIKKFTVERLSLYLVYCLEQAREGVFGRCNV